MNNKLVSIVIPVYNSERFLEECLNSILEQTYQNIEIIAIDDRSNDSSLDILNNFSNKIEMVVGYGWINGWYAQNLSYHLQSRPQWKMELESETNTGTIWIYGGKMSKFSQLGKCF